jgi:hypothetical protein
MAQSYLCFVFIKLVELGVNGFVQFLHFQIFLVLSFLHLLFKGGGMVSKKLNLTAVLGSVGCRAGMD